jgi:hypothetical protein
MLVVDGLERSHRSYEHPCDEIEMSEKGATEWTVGGRP